MIITAFISQSIHCHAMIGKLLLISLLVSHSVAIIFPSSPCPATFVYEDDSADNDRWYGELTIVSRESYNGITLRVTLDRPSHLIAVSNSLELLLLDSFVNTNYCNRVSERNCNVIDMDWSRNYHRQSSVYNWKHRRTNRQRRRV